MPRKGHVGASLGGAGFKTPGRRKRDARRRQGEEKRWASLAGPVTVIRLSPEELAARLGHSRSDC
jgi:hypothetical protein